MDNVWRSHIRRWTGGHGRKNARAVIILSLSLFMIFLLLTTTVLSDTKGVDVDAGKAPPSSVHFLANPNIKKIDPDDLECIPDALTLRTAAEDKFTIVMPTFNRKSTLTKILTHYLSMDKVDKLILVWFLEEGTVPEPDTLVDAPFRGKLLVKQIREDNLMLRFLPMEEIETQAVFSVDDDMMVAEADVTKAFEVWKVYPQGMVGWFMRLHIPNSDANSYRYIYNPTERYSMVLTNAGFYHRKWNYILINSLPGGIKDLVKRWVNCEDIAMNFLISSHCGRKGALYLRPGTPPDHFSQLKASLSGRRSHQKQRDECVTYFIKHYKRNPLHVKTVNETEIFLKSASLF